MTILVGQVETLLPDLIKAMEDVDKAKKHAEKLKVQMCTLIGSPQTVKTVWGSVTLVGSRRTVKITDKALNHQIQLLKETGVSEGKCTESFSAPFIKVIKSDR
jgi:hypothetical protein